MLRLNRVCIQYGTDVRSPYTVKYSNGTVRYSVHTRVLTAVRSTEYVRSREYCTVLGWIHVEGATIKGSKGAAKALFGKAQGPNCGYALHTCTE